MSAWEQLVEPARALVQAAQPPARTAEAARLCAEMLPPVRELVAESGREVAARVPELAARIAMRTQEPTATEFREAPIVLYGATTEDEIRGAWAAQLRHYAEGAAAFVASDRTCREFMMGWTEGAEDRFPFYRAEHLRDLLRDSLKLAALLEAPSRPVRLRKGKTQAKDDFTRGLGQWTCLGPGHFAAEDGWLRVRGGGNTFWFRQELGDGVIALDYRPRYLEGDGAGALFAFPAQPLTPQRLAVSTGAMSNYNYGIDTYHCSLCRGDTGRTNLRHTGRGLRMLSSTVPDPCTELGRAYRVEIVKHGPSLLVLVDGRLQHAYLDAGVYGPVHAKGYFGVRHFSAHVLSAEYGAFEASRLVSAQ